MCRDGHSLRACDARHAELIGFVYTYVCMCVCITYMFMCALHMY
jgi:hypothetical protein